ncbi:MAG: flavin reductase family protein [Conexivisphaerales archaeon]
MTKEQCFLRLKPIDITKSYRLFYPAVPAIVCAKHMKTVAAMPVISMVILSHNPPKLGLAISPRHLTYTILTQSQRFSVCLLDRRNVREVEKLGTTAGILGEDKLLQSGLRYHMTEDLHVPVPDTSVAALECRLQEDINYGDHNLIVGTIHNGWATDDFDEYWKFNTYHPILYTGIHNGFTTYI